MMMMMLLLLLLLMMMIIIIIIIIIIIQHGHLSKAKISSSSKISQDFEYPYAQYRVHNSLLPTPHSLIPILSQINPAHQHPILSPEDIFQYHAPIYDWVFNYSHYNTFPPPKPWTHLSSPNACYIIRLITWVPPLIITAITNNYYYFIDTYIQYTYTHVVLSRSVVT